MRNLASLKYLKISCVRGLSAIHFYLFLPYFKIVALAGFLMFCGCVSTKTQQTHIKPCDSSPSFPWNETTVYKASISVLNQNISGLILFSRENDSTIRLVMTNDVGPKLIDISLYPKGYSKNYVYKKLNRKALLRMFWEDFGTASGLFSRNGGAFGAEAHTCCFPVKKNFSACYVSDSANMTPSSASFCEGEKIKTKITYFCNHRQQPDSIRIEHTGFAMSYFLKKID